MTSISYTALRKQLSHVMDTIAQDHVPYHITRKDHPSMVMLSEDDYNALIETLYLLSNPANAEHLRESMAQATRGEWVDVDWNKK